MNEKYVKPIRSELYERILIIIKKLKLEKTDRDSYDYLSATMDLENMFIQYLKEKKNE